MIVLRKTFAQHAKQLSRPPVLFRPRQELTFKRFHHSTIMQQRAVLTNDFFFRQMFDDVSSTYTYLLGDVDSKEAIIIDPGWY